MRCCASVIDLHCHVLPGVDDGPATMDQALALLRDQRRAGVRTVVATSHVNHRWPDVTPEVLAAGVQAVNAAADAAGVEVTVKPGAEVSLTRATDLDDDTLRALRLGDGPWLLLEPPSAPVSASTLEFAIVALLHRGHRLLLAHPERCPAFHQDREVLGRLVTGGVRCSITAGALSGRFGRTVRRVALELLEGDLVHNLASDAHGGMPSRPAGLREHLDGTGFEGLAEWLCDEMPVALLSGDELPPRPAITRPRPRGLGRLLRRR